MKYKLLAIDMDGTFLNEEHNVTDGNLAAIKKASDKGIKVVICSGRTLEECIAIGNYENDLEMIKVAGTGIIVQDFLKAIEMIENIECVDISCRENDLEHRQAKEKQLYIFEAITTLYLPNFIHLVC